MGRIDIVTSQANKDWKRILPGLVISAISLAVVFYLADFGKLVESLRLANYGLVAAGFLITLVWLSVRALVWRTLLQEKARWNHVFFSINEGYLLNNILPFRLGEVGRAFLLGKKAGLGFWQVFSTVVIERVLDLAFAAGLLLSSLPFVVGATWARSAALSAVAIVLVGLGALYLLARQRELAMRWFEKLSLRWPILSKLGGKSLGHFFNGLAVLTQGSRFLQALFWMLLDWAIAIFQYYILLLAFFPDGKFLEAAFTLGVVALGIAAPSSPGAVGVMELSMVGALSIFNRDPSVALALALTSHLINYLLTGILGAYGLARDGETLMGLYHRARKIPQEENP